MLDKIRSYSFKIESMFLKVTGVKCGHVFCDANDRISRRTRTRNFRFQRGNSGAQGARVTVGATQQVSKGADYFEVIRV